MTPREQRRQRVRALAGAGLVFACRLTCGSAPATRPDLR